MYDSIKIWLPKDEIKDSGYIEHIPTILTNINTHYNQLTNLEYLSGNYNNLKICISEAGIGVNGSINKFYRNDNFQKINRQDTEMLFEKMKDECKIDFKNAKVSKLDIAHNFIVNEAVENYYYYLGQCQFYKRLEQPNSIYYNNSLKTKLFYNKVKEGKVKGVDIPLIWQNKNVLRYELRYTSRIAKQLNKSQILVQDLYNENFYMSMIDNWINEYNQINKNKIYMPTTNKLTNKNAKDTLLSGLIEIVGKNKVDELTTLWKQNFTTKREATRFKASLKDLKGLTGKSVLIDELNTKINEVKEYYR